MKVTRGFSVFAVVLLASVLLFGGILHTAIEHDHGNEILWTALHALLRHEEKTLFLLLLGALIVCVRFRADAALLSTVSHPLFRGTFFPLSYQYSLHGALAGGALSYRKFR